ncbi:MAG: serine/threonine protein kinase, partial [Myxococcales bacterium]|nr:serine/threonine protein kinase [Myxococcales bacterium]
MIRARRTIAGIELGRILGAGASAVVYAGRVRATRQRVAVKVVRPRPDHPADQIERALQEARVGWTVRHPNVVRVFEWGTTPEGEVYLVLERLEGRTLGALLAELGTVPAPRALAIGRQTAAGLAALHAHGALHRDVKPDNVFLVDEGGAEQVKLLDMGLVQLRLDHPHRMAWTAAGLSLGTPGYLAPEQARGDVATPATDVHGLGATLYHAIVGRAPYPTEATYDGLRAVALATAPP